MIIDEHALNSSAEPMCLVPYDIQMNTVVYIALHIRPLFVCLIRAFFNAQ